MPSPLHTYEILLDFTNDTHDCVTLQLLRDYGRSTSAIVLLHPTESISLVLDSGSVYRYALKTQTKVANVTARSWRDIRCEISHLFTSAANIPAQLASMPPVNGVVVDHLWRDYRFCLWNGP
ncbi:hypothetical protein BD779DRAFT_27888 [Infundibulicybe gibba]|nr:hypothetical protein BD779DRAFT_27888 [Infundibulicybe gibba]